MKEGISNLTKCLALFQKNDTEFSTTLFKQITVITVFTEQI